MKTTLPLETPPMFMLLSIVALVATIVAVICFIFVLIAMAQDWGILVAILSFCLCQIVVFVYGWFFWDSEIKYYVMGVWTLCILLVLGIEIGMGGRLSME